MSLVPLDKIRLDGNTQSRASLDSDTVKEYAEAYGESIALPPVVLFDDGEHLWMSDGRHRYGGAKLAGLADIEAEVRKGTERDALLFAVGCNAEHGLKRTTADKMHSVGLLLADTEWVNNSDRWIAEACKVSHTFVANIRNSTGVDSSSNGKTKRTGKDRKKRKVTARKTTKNARKNEQETSQEPESWKRIRDYLTANPDTSNKAVARELDLSEHVVAKVKKKMVEEREPGDDSEAETEEKKRKKKNGKELFDFSGFYNTFGKVARAPDQIAVAWPTERKSSEFQQCHTHLNAFITIFKSWHKKLTGGK